MTPIGHDGRTYNLALQCHGCFGARNSLLVATGMCRPTTLDAPVDCCSCGVVVHEAHDVLIDPETGRVA